MPWFNAPGQQTGSSWGGGFDGNAAGFMRPPQPFSNRGWGGGGLMGGSTLGQIGGGLMGMFGGGGRQLPSAWQAPQPMPAQAQGQPQAPQMPPQAQGGTLGSLREGYGMGRPNTMQGGQPMAPQTYTGWGGKTYTINPDGGNQLAGTPESPSPYRTVEERNAAMDDLFKQFQQQPGVAPTMQWDRTGLPRRTL